MSLPQKIAEVFNERFGCAPEYIARAPGRVNLLGEHVDYNDGFVLPAAIDRATYIAFSPTSSPHSTLWSADFAEDALFSPTDLPAKTQTDGSPLPNWARYPAGVMWALRDVGLSTPNMQAVYVSDVPRGAGLSSSASVEMAFGVAWQTLGGWTLPAMQLALLGQKAENQYVGVNCGIMDQFASACGEKDRLMLLDCRSLEYQALPLPKDTAIVIADTSVRRNLTTSAYNDRRAACEEAVRLLKQDLPDIKALRDVSVDEFSRLAHKLPEEVYKRARHIVEEIERTTRAIPLLQSGDVDGFGELMNECHASLRDFYEVSIQELNVMASAAQSLEGCYGARLTGAGFGGCVAALVARDHVSAFVKSLAAKYESQTRLHPEIYICEASDGAGILSR
ncbi:MAG: galactokinase [Chloroflexota bacterium]